MPRRSEAGSSMPRSTSANTGRMDAARLRSGKLESAEQVGLPVVSQETRDGNARTAAVATPERGALERTEQPRLARRLPASI